MIHDYRFSRPEGMRNFMADNDSLRDVLKSRNPELLRDTETIVGWTVHLLERSAATFPTGTLHDPRHTNTVENLARKLIPDQLIKLLRDDEIRLLILVCHFHDLGMSGTEANNKDPRSQDQARQDHAIRIGERICENWASFGFADENEAKVLSEICRGHRPKRIDGVANWNDLLSRMLLGPDRLVRTRLVAALLYAADELHIGNDRATSRVEEWLQLTDEESRRHWKRHQAVVGPFLDGNRILFQANVSTTIQEDDLRKHVFLKAGGAVRDANAQIRLEDLDANLRTIEVTWNRDELWKLFILEVLRDGIPRTQVQLASEIWQRFRSSFDGFTPLPDCCVEGSDDSDVRLRISAQIESQEKLRHLISAASSESLVLNPNSEFGEKHFKIARDADGVNALFGGKFASATYLELHRSAYGKEFVDGTLAPLVRKNFGINLATESSESDVLAILRLSPSAARMLRDYEPLPSIVVQRDLVRTLVATGGVFDLSQHPEVMLDKTFRQAIKRLTATIGGEQKNGIQFAEELALVGGFSLEVVTEAMKHDRTWDKRAVLQERELVADANIGGDDDDKSAWTLKLRQSGITRTSSQVAYNILAGVRAGIPIELRSTDLSSFSIAITPPSGQPVPPSPPEKVQFSPGSKAIVSRPSVRATFKVVEESKTIRFALQPLYKPNSAALPLLVDMPMPKAGVSKGLTEEGEFNFGMYFPALTAGEISVLRRFLASCVDDQVSVEMYFDDNDAVFGVTQIPAKELQRFYPIREQYLDAFAAVAPGSPIPYYFDDEEIEQFVAKGLEAGRELFNSCMSDIANKPVLQTALVRIANPAGQDISEELLRVKRDIQFRPTPDPDTPKEQVEVFENAWDSTTMDVMIQIFLQPDIADMSDKLRRWVSDANLPFPFGGTKDSVESPNYKTRFQIVKAAQIDRGWFIEQPFLFRLAPVNQVDKWEVEAAYWNSVGDSQREEILLERLETVKDPAESQLLNRPVE